MLDAIEGFICLHNLVLLITISKLLDCDNSGCPDSTVEFIEEKEVFVAVGVFSKANSDDLGWPDLAISVIEADLIGSQ